MNKEIIKLHSSGAKIIYFFMAGICLSIGIALLILNQWLFIDEPLPLVIFIFIWELILIFLGLWITYAVLFGGKIIIDFGKEEFVICKTFKRRMSFSSVTTIFLEEKVGYTRNGKGTFYFINFRLNSGELVKCSSYVFDSGNKEKYEDIVWRLKLFINKPNRNY